ncbi:MAG: hypothetical protein KJ559_03340 [Nanoarchaeota archaeon]|nr:hypothetical protein [Nanoarchaeota archaeon]
MKIRASVSWNPEVEFEQSDLVNILLSFENGESQEFKGQFKRLDTAMDYLWHLYVQATGDYGKGKEFVGEIVEDANGNRVYEIPIKIAGDNLERVKYTAGRVQKKYFIAPRNEWVTDEEYSTFFGSSNGLWDTERCDYPAGDFAESLRQTVYDMENRNPGIYRWTNVPSMSLLQDRIKSDPEFAQFAEKEIKPLVRKYWDDVSQTGNIPEIKRMFVQIAEVAEKYKHEQGIDRL